jgi:hypothetical protein
MGSKTLKVLCFALFVVFQKQGYLIAICSAFVLAGPSYQIVPAIKATTFEQGLIFTWSK